MEKWELKESTNLCYMKILKCKFSYFHQNTSSIHWDWRNRLVRENGLEPKNPLCAEKGDGWGLVITWCWFVSMSFFLEIAKFPHNINTRFLRCSDKSDITRSVNISHHFQLWDAGSPTLTVRTAFKRRTHSDAQSERSVDVRCIPRSVSSSLNIFLRLGCGLDPFGTENDMPIAAPGVW